MSLENAFQTAPKNSPEKLVPACFAGSLGRACRFGTAAQEATSDCSWHCNLPVDQRTYLESGSLAENTSSLGSAPFLCRFLAESESASIWTMWALPSVAERSTPRTHPDPDRKVTPPHGFRSGLLL